MDWFTRDLALVPGRAAADAIRQVGDGRLQAASGWSPARLCLMPSQGELEVEGFFNTSSTSPQGMPRPYWHTPWLRHCTQQIAVLY